MAGPPVCSRRCWSPLPSPQHRRRRRPAPSTPSRGGGQHVDCQPGATCTVDSHADGSGALSGESTYVRHRDGAATDAREFAWVDGAHSTELSVERGTRAVLVTATWNLTSLTVDAAATSGTTWAEVGVRIIVWQCEGEKATCRPTTPVRKTVAMVHDTPLGLPWGSAAPAPTQVTHTVRLEGSTIPRTLSVRADVGGAAGGYPDCVERTLGCVAKERHVGRASLHFAGHLKDVSVTPVS